MARFCQILCPLLLLIIFMIIVLPSNGKPESGMDLVNGICSYTSDRQFCVDTLTPDPRLPVWPSVGEIATTALSSAQSNADDARSLIASLLESSTCSVDDSKVVCQLLQRCQLLNNKTITGLSSAKKNFDSNTIDAMVEDLNNAVNATESCQVIIQGITSFSELASTNSILIKFCEISTASTKFFALSLNLL